MSSKALLKSLKCSFQRIASRAVSTLIFDYSSSSSSSNTCHWIANDDTVDRFILIEELFLSEISKVSTSLYKCTVELF